MASIPLPRPTSIRDFMAFEEHVRNARARRGADVPPEWYEAPTFYFSNSSPSALFGDGDVVPRPSYTQMLDIELETGGDYWIQIDNVNKVYGDSGFYQVYFTTSDDPLEWKP